MVKAMNANSDQYMVAGLIIDECRMLMKDPRKVIVVAHELARLGRNNPHELWLGAPPCSISSILVDDVTTV